MLKTLIFVILLVGIITPAFATYGDSFQPIDCIKEIKKGTICYSYLPPLEINNSTQSSLNWKMDIIAPDGTCNISGQVIQSSGSCTTPSVVLTQSDFDRLKSNPVVIAVINIQNSAMTPQQYCPVALWTWNTQDSSFKAKYDESLVVPDSCLNSTPEFGNTAMIILAIALLCLVIFTWKTKVKLFF